MIQSEAARAAAKKAQLARLAAKGSPDYPAIYAKQPEQIRRAAVLGAERKAVRDAKAAQNAVALSDAEGTVAVFDGAAPKKGKG